MRDTSPEMQARYYEGLARMSIAERAARMLALNRATTDLALAGIRAQFPNATPREQTAQLAFRRYGKAVARRFFPDVFTPEA